MTDFEGFKAELEADRDELQPGTIALYLGCVKQALARPGGPLAVLEDSSLGVSRRETYRRALLRWAAFTEDAALMEAVRDWRPPRKERRQKRVRGPVQALELDQEWPAFRAALRDVEPPVLRGALTLIATSGLRISEVLGLTVQDLAQAAAVGAAVITQKGGAPRSFYVADEEQRGLVQDLERALRAKRAATVLAGLVTRRRTSRKGIEGLIRRELERAAERAGIEKHLYPHLLRRTVIDAVYRVRGSIRDAQEAAGHASPRTTERWYQDHQHPEEARSVLSAALRGERKETKS